MLFHPKNSQGNENTAYHESNMYHDHGRLVKHALHFNAADRIAQVFLRPIWTLCIDGIALLGYFIGIVQSTYTLSFTWL